MTAMFRNVVVEGTGTEAAIPGYTVAGKTGTANKVENGVYVSKYVASFVGLVPARKPRLAILVMVDEPRGQIWGGVVAAPLFRDIARFALQYLEVPPDAPESKRSTALLAPRRSQPAMQQRVGATAKRAPSGSARRRRGSSGRIPPLRNPASRKLGPCVSTRSSARSHRTR